jgi:hypothetical protein
MDKTWRYLAVAVALILILPAAASAAIRIHKIRYDPPGADYTSNNQLRAEYIVVKNTGSKARQLRGWIVKDDEAASLATAFPRVVTSRSAQGLAKTTGATCIGTWTTSCGITMATGPRLGGKRARVTPAGIRVGKVPTRLSTASGFRLVS